MTSWTELPGPKSWNPLFGCALDYYREDPGVTAIKWEGIYGQTFRIQGPLMKYLLYSTDPTALRHVLSHPETFEKAPETREHLGKTLGQGVLVAEGEDHKRQRRVLNPAFAPSVVRTEYMPVFYEKTKQLVDVLDLMLSANPRIDMYSLLSHTTLDIIGTAGFGYEFGSLGADLRKAQRTRKIIAGQDDDVDDEEGEEGQNELAEAYRQLFPAETEFSARAIAANYWSGTTKKSVATVNRVGTAIIKAKKEAYAKGDPKSPVDTERRKNLLELIVNANMDPSTPDRGKLSDEEVLGNLTTLLFAGHDTSSSALSWMLLELSKDQALQQQLREELLSVGDERPGSDTVETLPLLDAFMKECLRIHPPVSSTSRCAVVDASLPLGQAVEGKRGAISEITISKGTPVIIPIITVNKNKTIWGPDAEMFRPSRWLDADGKKATPNSMPVPGIFQNLMTFNGGPSACIGVRFAATEMKVMLFTLLRNFAFAECDYKVILRSREVLISRPTCDGKVQLPLVVSRIKT